MEIRFDEILDRLDIGVLIIDKNYFIIYANKKAKDIFDVDLNLNPLCYSLFYQYSDPCPKCVKEYLTPKTPKIRLTRFLGKELFLIECCYFSEDKTLVFLKNVSDEFYYKGSFLNLLERLPVSVFFIKKGKIKYLNTLCEKNLGYTQQELLDKNFIEMLISPEDRFGIEKIFNKVLVEEKEEQCMLPLINKEGESRTHLGKCFIMKDIDKEKILVVASIDITEFLELKQRLDSIHRTQSFGNFLRSLVHDFNNVLQQVKEYLKDIEKNLYNPQKIKKYLTLTEKTLSSWIDLNKLLLDYTKEFKEIEAKKIEIIGFLKDNLELFQLIAGSHIFIQLDFDYLSSAWIPGDESFWRYIFLNFISNAKDAIEEEGTISILFRTRTEEGKKYLVIFIKDTGCGIPEEHLDKIFQPFFTTKEKSSGLGLFLVKSHINNIGGKIEVESKVGKGTTFRLYVPLVEFKKVEKERKKPEETYIVLVEDEEDIRKNLEEILKAEGYKIYAFSCGKEVKENIHMIERADLLISDLHLPDIKGGELYQILKQKFPNIDVIFLTGDIFGLADLPSNRVILKPFNIKDLFLKIKELLQ